MFLYPSKIYQKYFKSVLGAPRGRPGASAHGFGTLAAPQGGLAHAALRIKNEETRIVLRGLPRRGLVAWRFFQVANSDFQARCDESLQREPSNAHLRRLPEGILCMRSMRVQRPNVQLTCVLLYLGLARFNVETDIEKSRLRGGPVVK